MRRRMLGRVASVMHVRDCAQGVTERRKEGRKDSSMTLMVIGQREATECEGGLVRVEALLLSEKEASGRKYGWEQPQLHSAASSERTEGGSPGSPGGDKPTTLAC